MADFIGANQNINISDSNYYSQYLIPFKWLRDYVGWSWLQDDLTLFGWNGEAYSGNWPNHQNFYQNLHNNGINVLMCIQANNDNGSLDTYESWWPYETANGTGYSVESYKDKTSFIGQAAARFGRKGNHPLASILHTDKLQGQDLCRYFEDFNEPDLGWPGVWPASSYAYHYNACHDGAGMTPDANRPLMGVKNGDPQAIHVQGGMAGANVTTLNSIMAVLGQARMREVTEVINYHHYCAVMNSGGGAVSTNSGKGGVSPEHTSLGLKAITQPLIDWRNTYTPDAEIWCTEFGWDTRLTSGYHSDVYARNSYGNANLAQANYLLRSFAILKGIGVDKAFMFMYRDPGSDNSRFATCGVTLNSGSPPTRKQSYYYIATMQNVLGSLYFDKVEQEATGTPWIFNYSFKNAAPTTQRVYMLWCTAPTPTFDTGVTTANYQLNVPYMTSAEQRVCANNDLDGVSTTLTVQNSGQANAFVTVAQLSETPLFIITSGAFSPPTPTVFNRTVNGCDSVTLTWSASTGASSYVVYINTNNNSTTATPASTTSLNFTYTGLDEGKTYYFWVKAVSASGDSALTSSLTGIPVATVVPTTPSGVSAVATSSSNVRVTWNYVNNSSSVRIYRSKLDDTSTATVVTNLDNLVTQFIDRGLDAGTKYFYWVRGNNSIGLSAYSSSASVTTLSALNPNKDLKNAKVFPNPFKPGIQSIKIANLPPKTKLTIYTVGGELVRELNLTFEEFPSNIMTWDGKNMNGDFVAPGVYPYILKTAQNKTQTGKIIIE